MIKKANIEFENIEKKKREKYNPEKIFDSKHTQNVVSNVAEVEEKSLVLKKESLIAKIFNFIRLKIRRK